LFTGLSENDASFSAHTRRLFSAAARVTCWFGVNKPHEQKRLQ
jgi:hypothetical protein